MREILFRGKKVNKDKWIYGVPVKGTADDESEMLIVESVFNCEEYCCRGCNFDPVIPETVGQFTGLTDKNGKKIFEGDIVITRYPKGDICTIGDVQFDSGVFGAEWTAVKENKGMVGAWGQPHNLRRFDDDIIKNIEVIGNIYDNPELLEVE